MGRHLGRTYASRLKLHFFVADRFFLGIYRSENPPISHKQAQIDLIEEVLSWADVKSTSNVYFSHGWVFPIDRAGFRCRMRNRRKRSLSC